MKRMKRIALMLCVLVLLVSTLGTVAFAAAPVNAKIPVTIQLTGTVPAERETYIVELTPEQTTNPMPANAENGVAHLEIVGQAAGAMEITYNKVGIYNYTVRQIAGENTDCVYDAAVYQVTVFVTNAKNGGFDVSVVAYKDGAAEKSEIIFVNDYADPDEISISALKTMDGNTPKNGAFSFQLLDVSGKVVETVKNVGRNVNFSALSFNKAGTYHYKLKEVKGNVKTISYDKTVYDVVITVAKNAQNDYEAKLTYMKNDKVYSGTPVFSNVTINPEVPKTGDEGSIFGAAGGMAISAAAIFVVLYMMKRQKKQEGAE